MKVKIVQSPTYEDLEKAVNTQLSKLIKDRKKIIDIKYSATESYDKSQYAMIMYDTPVLKKH